MSITVRMLVLLLAFAAPATATPAATTPSAIVAAVCRGDLAHAWASVKSAKPGTEAPEDLVAAVWLAAFFRDATLQATLIRTLTGMAPPVGAMVDACTGQPVEIEWREIVQRLLDRNLDRLPIPTTLPRTNVAAGAPAPTASPPVQASPKPSENAPAPPAIPPADRGAPSPPNPPVADSRPPAPPPASSQAPAPAPAPQVPRVTVAKPAPSRATEPMGAIQVGAARSEASVPAIVARVLGAIPHLVTAEDVMVLPPGSGTNGLYLVRFQTTDPRGACAELSAQRIPCLVQAKP